MRALPLLEAGESSKDPLLVFAGDVYTDFDFARLMQSGCSTNAKLIMVDNTPHHPQGDFAIGADGCLESQGRLLTF